MGKSRCCTLKSVEEAQRGLRKFYSELFGWKIEEMGAWHRRRAATYWFIRGRRTAAYPAESFETNENMPPSYVMFYVQADDLQATLDKADEPRRTGSRTPYGHSRRQWDRSPCFMDPDNNVIGLHKS